MLPTFRILPLLLLLPLTVQGEDDPAETAAYSRERLLPLVSKPGKDRRLFTRYQKDGNATWNKDFWGASLGFEQFTGIGWGTDRAGVLVTPEHVVSAAHYGNNHVEGVHFHDKDGNFLGTRAVARVPKLALKNIGYDIRVVRLESPAPDGARIYPLPDPATQKQRAAWGELPAEQRPFLIATDWRNPRAKQPDDPENYQRWTSTRSAHPVLLASADTTVLSWAYGPKGDPAVDPSYHEVVNLGDSSHPLFWVTRSGLVLASTFSSTTAGPNFGHPDVQKELQEAIDELGGLRKYTLKFAPVP